MALDGVNCAMPAFDARCMLTVARCEIRRPKEPGHKRENPDNFTLVFNRFFYFIL